jgi:hypothetical protein
MAGLVQFEWWVHGKGYEIAQGLHADGSAVAVLIPVSEGLEEPAGAARRIDLRKRIGAFLTFAEEGASAEGALRFAKTFGLLGHPREDFHLVEVGDETKETGTAEPLAMWHREARQMRFAIDLWNAVRSKRPRPERVRPMVAAALREFPMFSSSPANVPLDALAHTDAALIEGDWEAGRIVPAARRVLTAFLESKLREVGVAAGFVIGTGPEVSLVFKPSTLLGALWAQLAEAVTGNKEHRRCLGCRKWIPIGWKAGGSRTNRRTCSDACRVRAHREGR